jgi:hypothetical protein
MMSGPKPVKFRQGWAVLTFNFGKAHYFTRAEAGVAYPLCGASPARVGMLLEAGTFKHCKRCEAKQGAMK